MFGRVTPLNLPRRSAVKALMVTIIIVILEIGTEPSNLAHAMDLYAFRKISLFYIVNTGFDYILYTYLKI